MSKADEDRAKAAALPEDDLIGVLLRQHARIHELLAEVRSASGTGGQGQTRKQQAFDELRELLAVHETGEELVLRPLSKSTAGAEIADARNREEDEATHVLAALEKMDVHSAEFDTHFARFQQAVTQHAESEEKEEFTAVQAAESTERLRELGRKLLAAEKRAPTHPHPTAAGSPTAQRTLGPFAAMLDRAKDAMRD